LREGIGGGRKSPCREDVWFGDSSFLGTSSHRGKTTVLKNTMIIGRKRKDRRYQKKSKPTSKR